jgi:ABC-type sugar transport system permease subunit
MIRSFYISLTDWNGFTSTKTFIGLKNFIDLFSDATMRIALGNTLFYLLFGGVVVFALAIWFAYLMTKKGFRGQKAFSNFFYFPNMVSPAALAVLWVFFFNTNFGLLNVILEKLGLGSLIVPWFGSRKSAMACITLASCIAHVGFYLILILSGINRIPPTFLEAASIDGAGRLRCFFKITLPLLRDVLVISVSLWIINAIKYFELIWAMFKGMTQYTQTLATYMYTVSFGVQVPIFKLGYGSAISVIMFLIVVVGISVFRKLFDREDLQY